MTREEQKARAREWFAEHQVQEHTTVRTEGGVEFEYLRWGKPGTGMYRLNFLRMGDTLMVTGDLYDAVYGWGGAPPKTLAWIAGCDVDYFASKCMASPHGRGFRNWDGEKAARQAEFWLADRDRWNGDFRMEDCTTCGGTGQAPGTTDDDDEPCPAEGCWGGEVEVPLPSRERVGFEKHEGADYIHDRHEWNEWLRDHGQEVFGDDWWEFTSFGDGVDLLCVAHLVGLQMAMDQLGLERDAA